MTRDTPIPDTSPIPVIVQRGRKDVRATLAVRSFRWVFVSMLVGSIGAWVSRIALDWLILELTGSVAAVGLAVTFQFAPILLFGLWGGSLSDRFPRLRVIRIANSTAAGVMIALAVLAQLDALMLWHIYAAAALGGLTAVVEGPARSALIAQVVPESGCRRRSASTPQRSTPPRWAASRRAALSSSSSVRRGRCRSPRSSRCCPSPR
ncbi:MFS transporter [Microbacterium sp. Se63.02b]|uniref:MFS transporter n=1 Tax=Microbacterium sp. Se63.02b TaxID=2709304 RepID=UPI001FCED3D2|nr:MFS transporter [Microbacterium sp. Se63.02b]